MQFTLACVAIGLLFVAMALAGSVLKRLPLTTALLYLLVGIALGAHGAGLFRLDALGHSALLERLTEVVVLFSLFTAGLKLRVAPRDARWKLPLRLAFGSMALTVGMVALVGVFGLGLPLGAAILLGAILAPTDPVLASDVQVERPTDHDRLRFSLTGEAGFNDGTAFPFVMLGLGLLGLHDLGPNGLRWLALDVVWAVAGGLLVGWLLGCGIGYLVLFLRREYREAVGLDDFLALGLIALSYGLALLAHTYGFLAVFAAGLALRHVEMCASPDEAPEDVVGASQAAADVELATDPDRAPAYMAQAVLGFNEQLERICEVGVVLLLGGMFTWAYLPAEALWFAPLLFLVIRPIAVVAGLWGTCVPGVQRRLIAWFGIRGVGSVYYLAFALQHGVTGETAARLTGLTLTVVALSIAVHGVSVTPLMSRYEKRTSPAGGDGGRSPGPQ
jgi:NhaP-type Na+/H+ or K+/H+ antiporter